MKKILLSAVLNLILLTGCASGGPPVTSDVAVISSDSGVRNAEIKLADAADSVSQSLQQLAEIERASHPTARLPSPPDPKLIGMGQLAAVEWTGPIGPLVDNIARASHYKLRKLGNSSAIPIIVSISAKDTPLADILRDAGFQCGNKASIVVYPASRTIELRYNRV